MVASSAAVSSVPLPASVRRRAPRLTPSQLTAGAQLLPAVLFLAFFFLLPAATLFAYSFLTQSAQGTVGLPLTAAHYAHFFGTTLYSHVLWTTLRISLVTTVAAALLAYPVALVMVRTTAAAARAITMIVIAPLIVSVVVRTYGWQVILGKFIGHVAILAFATFVGYGASGLAVALLADTEEAWGSFALMMASSVLLGAVFVAIGYVISVLVRDRGAGGGLAIGVWLLFVLIYDMALLGALVADQGRVLTAKTVNWLLLLNPTDAYRLLNLAGTSDVRLFSGMSGLAQQAHLGPATLAVVLILWIVAPLGAAMALFARREI